MADWLPSLMLRSPYPSVDEYHRALYEAFDRDFVLNAPRVQGLRFGLRRLDPVNGWHGAFWHMISTGNQGEKNRKLCEGRCERIAWSRVMIDKVGTQEVRAWKEKKNGDMRLHIALPDFTYLAVLSMRRDFVLLWTAFPVEFSHEQKTYEKQWRRSREEKIDPKIAEAAS